MSLFSLIAGGVSIHNWFPVPILMLVMMSDPGHPGPVQGQKLRRASAG